MAARLSFAGLLLAVGLAFSGPLLAQQAPVPAPRPAERMPDLPAGTTPDAAQPDVPAPLEAPAPLGTPASVAPSAAADAAAALSTELQPVHLEARVTDSGDAITKGVVWRVFEARADSSGELPLAAKSEDAIANLRLPPGQYVVHCAYGRAQASDTFEVVEGDNVKGIVIDAGAIRLNAAVTGDVAVPINLLHFDVFSAGPTESERTLVAENVGANDILTINAGTYHVVSYFGAVNAVVRADLRVEPGQLTDATVYHRAAQVSFKLVTEAGGEAIADVEWTVKTADGATVFTNIGAFPATVLEEGDYVVFAKRSDKIYNRAFEVQPGGPREVEVLTAVY